MSQVFRVMIDSQARVFHATIIHANDLGLPPSEKMLQKPLSDFFTQPDGFESFEKFIALQITKNHFNVVVRSKKTNLPFLAHFEKIWLSETQVGYLVSIENVLNADHLPDHIIKQALNHTSDAWLIIETNQANLWSGKVKYFNQSATLIFKDLSIGQFLKEKKHFAVHINNETEHKLEVAHQFYSFTPLHFNQHEAQKAIKLFIIKMN